MALPIADLLTWLTANSIPGVLANWMPEAPDQVVVASASPGASPTMDGHLEANHIHVRCRGASDAAAETTALAVHLLICQQQGSVLMGATRVISIEPASGGPVFLMRDTSNRTTYMATYLVNAPTPGT